MIIDAHCHLWSEDIPSRSWWETFIKVSASLSGKTEEKIRERLPDWIDLTGDMLLGDMDEAGIDKAVILPIDYGLLAGAGEVKSLEEQHQTFAKAVQRHPNRLILFAGLDPRRPDAVRFLERAVNDWGVKGLKLHPAVGFYPNAPCVYRLYEKCQKLGIPVVVHTGPEVYPMYSKYALPIFLDEVANDFPELRIVMAHCGGCYWEEAALIASNKLNLYLDLSWWQVQYLAHSEEGFYARLRTLVNMAGRTRVLFGSDWPGLRQIRRLNHAAWTKVIKEAPQRAKEKNITFTQEEIDGIMGNNAAKVLGI